MKNQILYDPCPSIWELIKAAVKTGVKLIKTKFNKIWNNCQ